MNLNHTPREWHAQLMACTPTVGRKYLVVTDDGGPIADVNLNWIPEGMNEANAMLIAAAPALLAAVKAGGEYSDALERYQAQGQSGKFVTASTLDRLFLDWHTKAHAALKKAGLE